MKIKIPKITKKLDLKEYAPEMEGAVIEVWVNPPRSMMFDFYRMRAISKGLLLRLEGLSEEQVDERRKIGEEMNAVGAEMATWFATIWSQGKDPETHWTLDEINQLLEHAQETDPKLWFWLLVRTHALISEHQGTSKKA